MKLVKQEHILNRVGKALDYQFDDVYSWFDMLDDCGFTPEELVWAKEHISYKVYVIK